MKKELNITNENITLSLKKSKDLITITDKLLSAETTKDLIDERWMQKLWDWADENDVPDVGCLKRGYWKGLPRKREELLNLTELNLECGRYVKLPKEIENLTNLTKLVNGYIDDHPNIISNLTSLKVLDLAYSVPSSICQLKNLEDLTLFNIHELPDCICNLTSLTSLEIFFMDATIH